MDQPRPIGNDGTVFRCPVCKTVLPHADVPTFPFCSDRCRMLDLANWIDGRYLVSRPVDPTDLGADIPRPPPPGAPRD